MGKEQLTIEVDQALMQRLRDAGIDPQTYVERVLARQANEPERTEARRQLRAEMQVGLDAYDRLIEEVGDWSAELRTF